MSKLHWCLGNNFGDKLAPILYKLLSGTDAQFVDENHCVKYVTIGSILNRASAGDTVWGSGLATQTDLVDKNITITAVRGPLTKEICDRHGVHCPEVYGDPALLYPKFYKPVISTKYELGIIPHYVDKGNAILGKLKYIPGIRIIDVTIGINRFIDELCSCEKIAASSLHGIIAADAYGIPSIWLKFSDKIVGSGFKFMDYFLSVKRPYQEPLVMNEYITLDDILKAFYHYEIDVDLNRLFDACPFRK